MKLTATQFRWLHWLNQHGGKAMPRGLKIAAGNAETNAGAAICFVNLIVKGAITMKDGHLEITDYGRRLLTP